MDFLARIREPEARRSFFDQIEKLLKYRTGVAGLIIITLFALTSLLAPAISPHDPIENALYDQLKPPV